MVHEKAFRIVFESAVKKAAHIPTGIAFPHDACSTFVLSNHRAEEIIGRKKADDKKNMFVNTRGAAFYFEQAADFDRRFKPVYADGEPVNHDGEWAIYYSTHAHDEEIVHHIAQNHRLPLSGIMDIAGMISSPRVTLQQFGKLFRSYADIECQDLVDQQVERNRKTKRGPNPLYIGA